MITDHGGSPARLRAVFMALTAGALALATNPSFGQGLGLDDLRHMMAWGRGSLVLIDKLEYAPRTDAGTVRLDATGWYGGAYDRLWFRAEAEQYASTRAGHGEAHLYYGRLVTPYWDALAGVRLDQRWGHGGDTRLHLGVGFGGLAPLSFEFAPTIFVSSKGDVSARLEAEYSLLVTQRITLEPEVELNVALQEVPEWEIGGGLNDLELGLRVRYEIIREIAPYVGFAWLRRIGETADLARAAGGDGSRTTVVAGVRMWW